MSSLLHQVFSPSHNSDDLKKRPSVVAVNHPGQGIVEFALVIPILLVMMFGIIEGGRLIFIYSSIAAAGREAARYGAGIGDVTSSKALYNDCDGIRAAATRIGTFAGVKPEDVTIAHDTGPGTTSVTYCAPSNTLDPAKIAKGDRITISVSTAYSPIVPLIPFPPLTLHSVSSHTILKEASVIAATPQSIPGGQTCDNTSYLISAESSSTGPNNTITITNNSGSATTISNILVIWDPTSHPKLISINGGTLGSGQTGLAVEGPYYSYTPSTPWNFPAGSRNFSLSFDKPLHNNVIIRITFSLGSETCTFGK